MRKEFTPSASSTTRSVPAISPGVQSYNLGELLMDEVIDSVLTDGGDTVAEDEAEGSSPVPPALEGLYKIAAETRTSVLADQTDIHDTSSAFVPSSAADGHKSEEVASRMRQKAKLDASLQWLSDIPKVDQLISEYLIFRGFYKTAEMFTREARKRRDLVSSVDRLLWFARNGRLREFLDTWHCFEQTVFCKLSVSHRMHVSQLYNAISKYLLVCLKKRGMNSQMFEYLTFLSSGGINHSSSSSSSSTDSQSAFGRSRIPNKGGDITQRVDGSEWLIWYSLPHITSPEKHPVFEAYFSKHFAFCVQVSLKNFITAALRTIPRPKLLCLDLINAQRDALQKENSELRKQLADAENKLRNIRPAMSASAMDGDLSDGAAVVRPRRGARSKRDRLKESRRSSSITAATAILRHPDSSVRSRDDISGKSRMKKSKSLRLPAEMNSFLPQSTGLMKAASTDDELSSRMIRSAPSAMKRRETMPMDDTALTGTTASSDDDEEEKMPEKGTHVSSSSASKSKRKRTGKKSKFRLGKLFGWSGEGDPSTAPSKKSSTVKTPEPSDHTDTTMERKID